MKRRTFFRGLPWRAARLRFLSSAAWTNLRILRKRLAASRAERRKRRITVRAAAKALRHFAFTVRASYLRTHVDRRSGIRRHDRVPAPFRHGRLPAPSPEEIDNSDGRERRRPQPPQERVFQRIPTLFRVPKNYQPQKQKKKRSNRHENGPLTRAVALNSNRQTAAPYGRFAPSAPSPSAVRRSLAPPGRA